MAPEQDKQRLQDKPSDGVAPSVAGEQGSPPGAGVPQALPHEPGVTAGCVDITGIVPEGIRIDPDITEGHPGYEESGDSEIIPPQRLADGEAAPQGTSQRGCASSSGN